MKFLNLMYKKKKKRKKKKNTDKMITSEKLFSADFDLLSLCNTLFFAVSHFKAKCRIRNANPHVQHSKLSMVICKEYFSGLDRLFYYCPFQGRLAPVSSDYFFSYNPV